MDSRATRKGFGLAIDEQKEVLNKAFEYVYNMRTPGSRKRKPCQNGICQDINGLLKLKVYLLKNYGVHYILTERLNQDCLERMFGYLRMKGGGLYTHPSPLEFFYRLRSSILGAYSFLECNGNLTYICWFKILFIGRTDSAQQVECFSSNIRTGRERVGYCSTGDLKRSVDHAMVKLSNPLEMPELKKQAFQNMGGILLYEQGKTAPPEFPVRVVHPRSRGTGRVHRWWIVEGVAEMPTSWETSREPWTAQKVPEQAEKRPGSPAFTAPYACWIRTGNYWKT